jgi:hypothetical protein
MKIIDENTIKLCCGGKKNCPVIERQADGSVKITDDDGGTVTIKKEELTMIPDAVAVITSRESAAKTVDGDTLLLG